MDIITKIIYLGLLIICAGIFYYKGYKDGSDKTCDNLIKFVTEYDKAKMNLILKNNDKPRKK